MIMLGLGHQQRRLLGAGAGAGAGAKAAIDPLRKAAGRTLVDGNYCLALPQPKPKSHLQTYPRQCRCHHRRFHRHLKHHPTREQQEQLGGFQSVQENTQSLRSAQGPLQLLLLLLLLLTLAGEAVQGLEPPAGAGKWHRRRAEASSWLVLGLTCFCQGHYWVQDQDQDMYVSLGLVPLRSPSR